MLAHAKDITCPPSSSRSTLLSAVYVYLCWEDLARGSQEHSELEVEGVNDSRERHGVRR